MRYYEGVGHVMVALIKSPRGRELRWESCKDTHDNDAQAAC